ncbi:MAG: hypothetical protein KBG15_14470, partial [Kofleriaceae bacterium]|nr:hypothetical protein [Kofleriaceae bacterium]
HADRNLFATQAIGIRIGDGEGCEFHAQRCGEHVKSAEDLYAAPGQIVVGAASNGGTYSAG